MAKDQRFFMNACIEIYVPDQGYGEKATANEELDAQWFANEVASQIPKAINKNFRFSERPYSVNDVMVGKIERGWYGLIFYIVWFSSDIRGHSNTRGNRDISIVRMGDCIMDAILHFFKHLIGLCGEAHPSLIMGGGVFITTMTIYFRQITDYIRSLF